MGSITLATGLARHRLSPVIVFRLCLRPMQVQRRFPVEQHKARPPGSRRRARDCEGMRIEIDAGPETWHLPHIGRQKNDGFTGRSMSLFAERAAAHGRVRFADEERDAIMTLDLSLRPAPIPGRESSPPWRFYPPGETGHNVWLPSLSYPGWHSSPARTIRFP